jgi:predicted nucleotidyltransferase
MRLTAQQTEQIVAVIQHHFGDSARVALFGSRLRDDGRGGDVDLLVEAPTVPTLLQRASATMALEDALQIPVDILAVKQGEAGSAFVQAIRPRATPLEPLK